MKKNIVLLDIKMGNVDSIIKAVEYNGYKCKLSNSRKDLEKSDIIILPGQGAFDSAMKNIRNLKIEQTLIEKSKDKTLFLGICLGMHLMADFGYENNKKTRGLGLINGEVKILPKKKMDNIELSKLCGIPANEIFIKTGIKFRRIAEKDETASMMGLKASKDAIKRSKLNKNDIDR